MQEQTYDTGQFAEKLLKILSSEDGIQAMLDCAHDFFQSPICVLDPDFHLVACTSDIIQEGQRGMRILENRGFTNDEFNVMNESPIHKRLLTSDYPLKHIHPTDHYEQLLCSISAKKDMGHIVVNGLNRSFDDHDLELLNILKMAICNQMKKDEFIRNNMGFHYEYFLRDLLDQKMVVGKAYHDRMGYVQKTFFGNLYCMVIETARSSITLNTAHVRSLFESTFPDTITIMYNGGIVVIFRLLDNRFFNDSDYEKMNDICKEYGLFAGISNAFRNIMHVLSYYHQALHSIELGVRSGIDPGMFVYKNYYMAHLTTLFSQQESPHTFCHPQMKILMDYDRENQTDYATILYVYLTSERNMALTAQKMYMHRNTLVYRLKKLNSMVSIDYEDYNERHHLILSYELLTLT